MPVHLVSIVTYPRLRRFSLDLLNCLSVQCQYKLLPSLYPSVISPSILPTLKSLLEKSFWVKFICPETEFFLQNSVFFRNPEGRPLFNGILSPYSANRVRSIVGAWFPSPMGRETQPLPCDVARCGLTNPQHRGIIPCFLKQGSKRLVVAS